MVLDWVSANIVYEMKKILKTTKSECVQQFASSFQPTVQEVDLGMVPRS